MCILRLLIVVKTVEVGRCWWESWGLEGRIVGAKISILCAKQDAERQGSGASEIS